VDTSGWAAAADESKPLCRDVLLEVGDENGRFRFFVHTYGDAAPNNGMGTYKPK